MSIITITGTLDEKLVAKERLIGTDADLDRKAERIAATWRESGLTVEIREKSTAQN